ncbi:phosphoenolpyruvate carboxylase [Acetobacteraceae bacterium]|nr:phosphoenolpyruvate carboxylase [Acetobacteraceae bacterium]
MKTMNLPDLKQALLTSSNFTEACNLSFETLQSPNGIENIAALIRDLRDQQKKIRAKKLHFYSKNKSIKQEERVLLLRDTAAFLLNNTTSLEQLESARASAVFTAHPTFALKDEVYEELTALADNPDQKTAHRESDRRSAPPTLHEEERLSLTAISRGRDALDLLNLNLIQQAKTHSSSKEEFLPSPLLFATWVGFDIDGRNDIRWWDALSYRLLLKRAQLERLLKQITSLETDVEEKQSFILRLDEALVALDKQISACPKTKNAETPSLDEIQLFSKALTDVTEKSLLKARDLTPFFDALSKKLPREKSEELQSWKAAFLSHGLGLGLMQARINAAQLYNIARTRLGLSDDPTIPSHRRVLIDHINHALKDLSPVAINLGSILGEPSAAARMMMTMAQILKHIDQDSPIRFLIAETESGYTLLAALWLARFFGVDDRKIEISPLFETETALENGGAILEEAFKSPHWRNYIEKNGKLCLQFGYSDSGRYVGQLAATPLTARLKLKSAELLEEYKLGKTELVFFDTHGESIGRGAHPKSLHDRLNYFTPPSLKQKWGETEIKIRTENAFQGADGYLLFGSPQLAADAVSTIVSFAYPPISKNPKEILDPIEKNGSIIGDFFETIARSMADLIKDPGYAALLGTFGNSLIDATGSRAASRQGNKAPKINSPRQLRAIPNNAILLQLGWWANIIHGLGSAVQRHPEAFQEFQEKSPRFRLLIDFAEQALAHSDLDVLRGITTLLNPGLWLEYAENSKDGKRRNQFLEIASGLEKLNVWKDASATFRRLQRDYISLDSAVENIPHMAKEEKILHAVRIALIKEIWLLGTQVPYFGPQDGLSRESVTERTLLLDIQSLLKNLRSLFPKLPIKNTHLDFGEDGEVTNSQGFLKENQTILDPMEKCFNLLRECGVAIQHANGAFG